MNPGAVELCDEGGLDENCNGLANDADTDQEGTRPAFFDADDDDYGDDATAVEVCEVPARYVDEGGDCNDNDRRINLGAIEVCDPLDVDENCNGDADDEDDETDPETMTEHYSDTDGDGWGGDARTPSCDGRNDESDRPGDCDDLDPDVNPEAAEVWYNGVDEDCDAGSDYDADRDGYDSNAHGGRDCDDASADAHPGGTAVWYDGVDGDCNGRSDFDRDGDGYDSDAYGGDDCDDNNTSYHPGATETGTVDYNCSGSGEPTPVADADYVGSSSLKTCSTITLDGSGSSDPRGSALTYAWELIDWPSGALETDEDIHDVDDAGPTFAGATAGAYTFGLVVTNTSDVESPRDELVLTLTERTSNTAPVAKAGSDQTSSATATCVSEAYVSACDLCPAATFVLSGTGSTDADTEPLTYAWAVTSGTATLSAATGDTVTVTTAPVSPSSGSTTTTTIVVTVTATDCYGDRSTDSVTLTASCTGS